LKFRPIYIYGLILIVAIIGIAIISQNYDENHAPQSAVSTDQETAIPNDVVHQGMTQNGGSPGAGNVMDKVKMKMKSFENDLKENPNDTTKIKEYADFLVMAHQVEKAVENYKKILKVDANRTDVLNSIVFSYYRISDFNNAWTYNQMLLKVDPVNLPGLYNLGAIRASEGATEEAKKYWKDLIAKYPNTEAGKLASENLKKL